MIGTKQMLIVNITKMKKIISNNNDDNIMMV